MSKKSNFLVEVVIKEQRGAHSGTVDKFKGTPELVCKFLNDKYLGRKEGVFDWLGKPFTVAGEHMEHLQRR